MYPHRIRLRGPWDCEPLANAEANELDSLPEPRRIVMPCRWQTSGLAKFRGNVCFRRRFGYPGRIDSHERVWLTIDGLDKSAAASLNGSPLGNAVETDVTALLQERNELRIEITCNEESRLWREAALEVRCTAYLRQVLLEPLKSGQGVFLHARGELVGQAPGPLEIYVVLNRATVAYKVLSTESAATAFHLVSDVLDARLWRSGPVPAKVDLVFGASVWYTVEQETALDIEPHVESPS